jgi:hypothetical protein
MSEQENKGLQGTFGDKGQKNSISYEHEHAEELKKEARLMMRPSVTGLSLWKVSELYDIPLKILKGKGNCTYLPEQNVIIAYVPAGLNQVKPKLILDLCQGFRLAEQHLLGFTAPSKDEDVFTYASIMHAKTIDAITYMCKTVEELKNESYYSILLDEVKKLGHGMVYKAYVENASDEDMADAYAGRK